MGNFHNMHINKILVTGASGMVGGTILRMLVKKLPDVKIRGIWYSTRPDFIHRNIEYLNADLTQRDECRKVVCGCDMAIMAASVTAGNLMPASHIGKQVTDNIAMDSFLLEAIAGSTMQKVIYLSSGTVYQNKNGKLKEKELDWNKDPPAPYFGIGWAKRIAEKLCEFWSVKANIPIVILRCSNIYGPGAIFDPQRSNFIPALIRKAVDRESPFRVYGTAGVRRDVLFVDDAAEAVVKLLKSRRIKGGVFNLCYGHSITVGGVVRLVLSATAYSDAKVIYCGGRTSVYRREFDGKLLQKMIGWKPSTSPEEGIKKTVLWWIKNKERWCK